MDTESNTADLASALSRDSSDAQSSSVHGHRNVDDTARASGGTAKMRSSDASGADPSDESNGHHAGTTKTSPYDFTIDLTQDSTHAKVVRMVEDSCRVLELGPASGYMSKVFQERGSTVVGIEIDADMAKQASKFCERVIVGDLDVMDFDAELGEERFDAIVAADVLEHLKDPLRVLRCLRQFLQPHGSFVVSLPNIAHASVRLALLQGSFKYRDLGLLDRTHLRFFTHESIGELFDEAELALVEVHRQEAPVTVTDVPVDLAAVSNDLIKELEQDPDARTYQFVMKALPLEMPGLRELQRRLRSSALAADTAQKLAADTVQKDAARREQDEARVRNLEEALAQLAGREGELRTALIDAHDQLLRRDEEIAALQDELNDARRADMERDAAEDQARRLRVRLERILNSPPARMYARVSGLPLVRRVVARRTAGYLDALHRANNSDG